VATMALADILQRWLALHHGGELPTEPASAPAAGEQLALPLQWDGPDRGVSWVPLGEPLKIRRRGARGRRSVRAGARRER
jgi:hypothetical protein